MPYPLKNNDFSLPAASEYRIRSYREADKADFERCNRWWLEQHFAVEPIDAAIFADPEGMILSPVATSSSPRMRKVP